MYSLKCSLHYALPVAGAMVADDAASSMAERIRGMKIGLLTMIDRGAPTRAQIGRQAWGGLKWTMPVRPSSDAEAEIVGLGIVRTWVYSIVVRAGAPTSCPWQ